MNTRATYNERNRSWFSALVATAAMISAFAAAAVPIPLYSYYQSVIGLSDADVSLTIVFYLIGVLGTLFFGGKLSDALGRKPLVIAALIFGIAGCALFAVLQNGFMLQLARFIQGVSCALTMSATSAFVIDCTSHHHRTFGLTVASTGALVGLTVGSLFVALFSLITTNYPLLYGVIIAFMLAIMLFVPAAHEAVNHRITIKHAIQPIVHVPENLRSVFPITAGSYIAAWGIGMFFQSLSTPAAVQYFNATDPLMPSLLLAFAMAPSVIGGPIASRMSTTSALKLGTVLMYAACVGFWASMAFHSLAASLIFDVLFGVSTGIMLSASMQMLVALSSPSENATVVSLINFTGYVGSTIMSVSMSALAVNFDIALVFALVVALSLIFIAPAAYCLIKQKA